MRKPTTIAARLACAAAAAAASFSCSTPRRTADPRPEASELAAPRPENAPASPPAASLSFEELFADGTLDLGEALALAAARHPDVVLARAEIGIADARVAIAETWPYDPEINLEGSTDYFFSDEGEGDRSIGLSQTFETGGGRGRRGEAARASRRAAQEDVAAAEWRARSAVSHAYYALLAAAEEKSLSVRRRDIAARLAEIAEIRLRAADVSLVDANLVRAAGLRAEAALAAAERERAAASLRLARLLGLPPRTDLVAEGPLPPPTRVEVAGLEDVALDHRREIAAARAERDAAMSRADAASASLWPDVTLDLFYGRETTVFDVGPDTSTDRDDVLGLGLTVPLPLFGRATGARQEALAEAARESVRLEVVSEDVRTEVREAALRAETAHRLVALYEEKLNSIAEENRSLVSEAFRLGQVGAIEVLRAQEEEAAIEEGYLAARHDAVRARVALESALGLEIETALAARSARERMDGKEGRP